MNIVINKLFIIVILLSGCDAIFPGERCNPADSIPYTKSDIGESYCTNKCCEFIVHSANEACHEMWCYSDCAWKMMHKYCY